jgi:alkylhydroperoxidase family enzyme
MRLVFFFTRRKFGKVLTPLTVFSARMPLAFGSFYGKVAKLDKKLELTAATVMLVRQRVSNINGCHFCIDIAQWFAAQEHPELLERLEALGDYRTSPLFSEAERAALDYATSAPTGSARCQAAASPRPPLGPPRRVYRTFLEARLLRL